MSSSPVTSSSSSSLSLPSSPSQPAYNAPAGGTQNEDDMGLMKTELAGLRAAMDQMLALQQASMLPQQAQQPQAPLTQAPTLPQAPMPPQPPQQLPAPQPQVPVQPQAAEPSDTTIALKQLLSSRGSADVLRSITPFAPGSNPFEWATRLEQLLKMYHVPEDEWAQLISGLLSHSSGAAEFPAAVQQHDWHGRQVINEFRARYCGKKAFSDLWVKFNVPIPGETLGQMWTRVRYLRHIASDIIAEEQIGGWFTCRWPGKYLRQLLDKSGLTICPTFATIEQIIDKISHLPAGVLTADTTSPEIHPRPLAVASLKRHRDGDDTPTPQHKRPRPGSSSPPPCAVCGRTNHPTERCFRNQQSQRPQFAQRGRPFPHQQQGRHGSGHGGK